MGVITGDETLEAEPMFEDFLFYMTAVLMFLGGIGAGVYLVTTGHPWFALLVFLMTACLNLRSTKGEKKEAKEK